MKYKTADYIRSFVLALSLESGNDSFQCACVQRVDDGDHWECCLFSRYDYVADYWNLIVLAKAICALCPTLTMYEGRYNRATHGTSYVSSIIIW